MADDALVTPQPERKVRLCATCLHDGVLELALARAEAAEAKVAALEAALRRHAQWFEAEKGARVCGGCLKPAPCPDAALLGAQS